MRTEKRDAYRVAGVQVEGEPKCVAKHKERKCDAQHDPGQWSLVQRGVEEDAPATQGFGLVAQSLQAEDKKTVSVVHSG